MTRILGIDPGLRNTGWGVIAAQGSRLSFIACGRVRSDASLNMGERLRQLHDGLMGVIADHAPQEAAIEERDHAAIGFGAQQAARGLYDADHAGHCIGQLEAPIEALLEVLGEQGAARAPGRQAGADDGHRAEAGARVVHAFREAAAGDGENQQVVAAA